MSRTYTCHVHVHVHVNNFSDWLAADTKSILTLVHVCITLIKIKAEMSLDRSAYRFNPT